MLRLGRELVDRFAERDLLTYASAVAFQVLLAVVPMALTAAALLGFLGLQEVWQDELRAEVEAAMAPDAFRVVDRTVQDALGEKQLVWLTFGVAFTIWQLSGAVRSTSGPLNLVYEVEEDRPWVPRVVASILTSIAMLPLLVAAIVSFAFGDGLLGLGPVVGFVVRWGLSAMFLLTVVWLLIRFTPAVRPQAHWISVGSGLVVGGWLVAAALYSFYLEHIASYESIFGNLASAFVLLSFFYILAVVFLGGVQVDAMLRHRHAEGPPGDPGDENGDARRERVEREAKEPVGVPR